MTTIITGGDGYLGWPTALRTAERTDNRIILENDHWAIKQEHRSCLQE